MTRIRKRKALYEVIDRKRSDHDYGEAVGPLRADGRDTNETSVEASAGSMVRGWPAKPRLVQFIAGRIEISMPYQLAIAVLLGIVLLVVVFFRLGQMNVFAPDKVAQQPVATENKLPPVKKIVKKKTPARSERASENSPLVSKGKNVIVIATSSQRSDLEPVMNYYAGYGIATEITDFGGGFQLWTKNKFENPGKPGTDGYDMLTRIKKLGINYKAPPGKSSFGQKFQDAYGMKVVD
ncbi:hypothetical protein ACFL3G_02770 [Planctomycetota bacterium]